MENTNLIFFSNEYQELLGRLEFLEKDRIFCKHNLEHFLDVARICYILISENKLDISKDLIYTTALLHDIGRVDEYENKIDHNIASVNISKNLLELTNFSSQDKDLIINCISKHRDVSNDEVFYELFYKADKLSRACYTCKARNKCYWSDDKKNMKIIY